MHTPHALTSPSTPAVAAAGSSKTPAAPITAHFGDVLEQCRLGRWRWGLPWVVHCSFVGPLVRKVLGEVLQVCGLGLLGKAQANLRTARGVNEGGFGDCCDAVV